MPLLTIPNEAYEIFIDCFSLLSELNHSLLLLPATLHVPPLYAMLVPVFFPAVNLQQRDVWKKTWALPLPSLDDQRSLCNAVGSELHLEQNLAR